MQAKDYAKKYRDALTNEDQHVFADGLRELFNELLIELKGMLKTRHISTDSGFLSLAREVNQKANKIADLLDNSVKKDWFKILLEDVMNMEIPL
jgi:hypothetical protein